MPLVESPTQEFLDLYGEEAWKDWRRLLAHFDLGQGFAFLVLLLPGAIGANICRRQLAEYLATKGKELAVLGCDEYEDVRRLPERLFSLEIKPNLGGVWLGSVISESDAESERWKEAWRIGLASLNQQRNPISRHFQCPLIIVGAPWLQTLLREIAPDLWSIRTAVVHVTASPQSIPAIRSETNRQITTEERFGEAASDPDYAYEQAERLRDRPGLETTRAQLLLRAGNGFRKRARFGQTERCFREAADIYAKIVFPAPDVQQDWAGALNNLAISLATLGRYEEALAVAEDAARIARKLAQDQPDLFLPDLAMSLQTLGNRLGDLGRNEEALATEQEALRTIQKLARVTSNNFTHDIATLLNNIGNQLSILGRNEEALVAGQEAVKTWRSLAELRPAESLSDLAVALQNLATVLSDLGRFEEALQGAREAIQIHEKLAGTRPDTFQRSLAMSYGALGSIFQDMKQFSDAADSFARGLRILTPLFRNAPKQFSRLMGDLSKSYLEGTQRAKTEPDMTLLAPIVEILENLNENSRK